MTYDIRTFNDLIEACSNENKTINIENQDEQCDLDYTPNKAVKHEMEYGLSNSFGFGGTNASLVFKKYAE